MTLPSEEPRTVRPPRSPWQRLYAGAHHLRYRFWRSRAHRLPRPVISLGNLHWGGTGKTPLTLAVAAWLRDRGTRVAVLSRGYGRSDTRPTLVSRGDGPLVDVGRSGDEPFLMAARLTGVAVAVAPHRFDAGRLALAEVDPPPEIFLLDDGFSHLNLARDLDLLLFPSSDPLAGGRLPPSGRLREPLAATSRADALLVTGEPTAGEGKRLAESLRVCGFRGPGFDAPTRSRVLESDAPPRPRLSPCRALLVSAVARSSGVEASARAAGLEVVEHVALRDHHAYPESTVASLRERFAASGAEVLATTAKDEVKLRDRLDLPTVVLDLEARPEADFWEWLEGRVDELLRHASERAPTP